jgi:hypothetical protein
MTETLRLLSLASLLVTGLAAGSLAATRESPSGNQLVPGTQTPATGDRTPGTYGMNRQSDQGYPSAVGPTGSIQPDATNPNRSAPQGEGGNSSAGGNAGAGGSSGTR